MLNMPPMHVAAADGDVVAIPEARAAASGVLARLPQRAVDEALPIVPFAAAHLRCWAAFTPDGLTTLEDILAALQVRPPARYLHLR